MNTKVEALLDKTADFLISSGGKLLYCIVILILCSIALAASRKMIHHFFVKRLENSKLFDERKAYTMDSIVSSLVKYILYFIATFTILTQMGIPIASLVAVAGVGSVAIGFGAKSLVEDVISGFFILLEDQFGVGDIVTIEGHDGTVENISIRTTHVRGFDGTMYIIPNGLIKIVTNYCKDFINAIVDIDISYNEDMDHVLEVLRDEAAKSASRLSNLLAPPEVLGITNLGESSVTVRTVAKCKIKGNAEAERLLRLWFKKRLDQEGIDIPFPQRTIHIANFPSNEEVAK